MTSAAPLQPGFAPPALGPVGKQRNPIGVVLLSFITFGIYWLVYVFKTFDSTKRHSGLGIGAGVALFLAIFVGIAIPFVLGSEVGNLRQRAGLEPRVSALTAFWGLIPIAGAFIYMVKVQGSLNDYWASRG